MKSLVAVGLGLSLAVLFAYASVLHGGPFGVNDDYQYLQRVYTGTFDPAHNEQTGMGRPAAAWMLEAAYLLCYGSVGNLVYLRLAGLAGIVLFAAALCQTLRRFGQGEKAALAMVACVAFSPACGVYAAWAAAFLSPYALTLCLLAGSLLQGRAAGPARRWLRAAGASGLILLACTLWQAAAPMALLAGFAEVWRRSERGEPLGAAIRSSRLPSAWMIVGATVLVYLLGQRLVVLLGWVHGAGLERMSLATDWRSKAALLGALLRSGFASWARLHSGAWEWPVAGLTLATVGAAILGRTSAGRPTAAGAGRRALLAGFMILASVSPLLAASENNAAFRSLPVLYTTVAFLAVEGVVRWRWHAPAWGDTAAGGGLVLLMGASAAYHVRAGIVQPNAREYRAASQLIQRQFRTMPPRLVYLVPPPVLLAPATMKPSWEYGLVSSPFSWVTKPFLMLVFHDLGMCTKPTPARLELVFREKGHADLPVLNPMAAMLDETGTWRVDARWGREQAFSNGWIYSPWFGYLNVKDFPIIQHHILGPLLYIGSGSGDLWLYKEGLGKFFTSEAAFPSLYVSERKDWVYLLDTDRSHCAVRVADGRQVLLSDR